DGIRDKLVTGVQTCALPIWFFGSFAIIKTDRAAPANPIEPIIRCTEFVPPLLVRCVMHRIATPCRSAIFTNGFRSARTSPFLYRSEERRVGKECRSWWCR